MAMRFGCCLNLPPLTPTNNKSFPPKTSQLSIWKKSGEERPRNLPCAIAAIVIGVELAAIVISPSSPHVAIRVEQQAVAAASHTQPPRARVAAPPKWSDTIRTCPAWRGNSLESIMPENLPRPSAHRRTETVRLPAANGEAPPVKFSVQRDVDGGCFNM